MPIFGGQKKQPIERRRLNNMAVEGEKPATPPLPPPPGLEPPRRVPPPSLFPSRHELIFHCQLAHGSPTREIKDFSNVKELYARIAEVFGISPSEVCFVQTRHSSFPLPHPLLILVLSWLEPGTMFPVRIIFQMHPWLVHMHVIFTSSVNVPVQATE